MIKTLCLFLSWGLAVTLMAQPQLTATSPVEWLKAVPTQGLRSTNPHVHNQDRLAKALPLAVDITNQGTSSIEVLALVFNVKYRGRPDTVRKEFIYNSLNNPNEPVVAPGVTRLFTPFRTFNALAAGARDAHLLDRNGKPVQEEVDKLLLTAESIRADVDAVVLEDSSYFGPDTTRTIKTYTDRSRAFQDMRGELTARVRRGTNVKTWLQSVASQTVVHIDKDLPATAYQDAQIQYAKIFLSHLNQVGTDGLVRSLTKTSRFQGKLLLLHKGDQ